MDERLRKDWPGDLAPDLTYLKGQKPLHEYLRDNALLNPERIAIIWYGREITYGELNDLSERFASFLSGSGVKKGERVALFSPIVPSILLLIMASRKSGRSSVLAVHCLRSGNWSIN